MFKTIQNILLSKSRRLKKEEASLGYDHLKDDFATMLDKINTYFSHHPEHAVLYKAELEYLNSYVNNLDSDVQKLYSVLPYSFTCNYNYAKVDVYRDEEAGMYYVLLNGKRLYYHKGYNSVESVQKSFTYISAEQDMRSPHRYFDDDFYVKENEVAADLGAAEGNFSLMVVDKVKELFIFEADEIWMEALHKTFLPWQDKVHIINKFVGDKVAENTISLKEFFRNRKLNFIKMDIEGMEVQVIADSIDFISERKLKMVITTYHRQSDADVINHLLCEKNYRTSFSKNYMLFIYDHLLPPYFRKAIIRATNNVD